MTLVLMYITRNTTAIQCVNNIGNSRMLVIEVAVLFTQALAGENNCRKLPPPCQRENKTKCVRCPRWSTGRRTVPPASP